MTAWETAMQQIRELKAENERLRAERDDYRKAIERALAEHDDTKTLFDVLSKWEAITASGKEVTEATR
jgi:predicted  nucleic acid-binding Zn-ribbon protein